MSKSIALIGAGAIGGWLGGRLALAGHDVTILREERRITADHELLVLSEGGAEKRVRLPVAPRLDGQPDLLLIAVKAMYLPEIVPLAAGAIGPGTMVLPLQNGVPFWFLDKTTITEVDPVGSIRAAIPRDNIIGNVVHASTEREGSWIKIVKADRLLLGEPGGGVSSRVCDLKDLFEEAGVPAEGESDIRTAIWYKLWGNLTLNPISALTRATVDRLLKDKQVVALVAGAMEEMREVGAAVGCPIDESVEERLDVARKLGAFKTSMLQDVENGRPLEWQALVAAPHALAKMHDIETPFTDTLLGLTRQLSHSL